MQGGDTPTPPGQEVQAGGQSPESMQTTLEKLKAAFDLSAKTCDPFIQAEAKSQTERSSRNTSMTSMSMFTAFRSDISFPPIIDSSQFKQSKYLGLCKKIYAPADAASTDTSRSQSSTSMPPVLTESQSFDGNSNIQIPVFGDSRASSETAISQIVPPVLPVQAGSSIPPPPPGGIPPPPPISINLLLKKSDEIRKTNENNKTDQSWGPSTTSNDAGVENSGPIDYKNQLAMLIGKSQGIPVSQVAPISPAVDTHDIKKKSILASALSGQGQRLTPAGFFDDDDGDDQGDQPSLLKKKKPTEVSTYDFEDVKAADEPALTKKETKGKDMLESILAGEKKSAPKLEEDPSPFTKRQTKASKKTIFDDDDDDEGTQKRQRKADKFLDDDSDEEKERNKLLKKYGKGGTKKKDDSGDEELSKPHKNTKIEKEEPTQKKSKKAALLEESDEDVPLPKQKSKKIEEKPPVANSTPEIEPKLPKSKKEAKKNELLVPEVPVPIIKKKMPAEVIEEKAANIDISTPSPDKGGNDFLSKLNSQLQQRPKEGIGLVKSIVGENVGGPGSLPDDEPSLLNPEYRSLRKSVDDRAEIKSVAEMYRESEEELWKTAPGQQHVPYRPSSKKQSVAIAEDRQSNGSKPSSKKHSEAIEDLTQSRDRPHLQKTHKASESKMEVKETPVPSKSEPKTQGMLRGKKKDPFASSSNSEGEDIKPPSRSIIRESEKPKVEEQRVEVINDVKKEETKPMMLRGNKKKDPFESSEEEADIKSNKKDIPLSVQPEKQMESRKNKLLEGEKSDEKFKEPAKVVDKKPAFKDDSDDDLPKPKAAHNKPGKKKALLVDSDEDDAPPLPKKKPTADKKLIKESSDEEEKVAKKKVPAQGKRKLFEDSD